MFFLIIYFVNNKFNDVLCLLFLLLIYKNLVKFDKYCVFYIGIVLFLRIKKYVFDFVLLSFGMLYILEVNFFLIYLFFFIFCFD